MSGLAWQHTQFLHQHSSVTSLAISPDGQTLVSGGGNVHNITIWNLSTHTQMRTLHGHTDIIHSVAISPGGRTLVSSSSDGTIKFWDLLNGSERSTDYVGDGVRSVQCIAISPNGQTLIGG